MRGKESIKESRLLGKSIEVCKNGCILVIDSTQYIFDLSDEGFIRDNDFAVADSDELGVLHNGSYVSVDSVLCPLGDGDNEVLHLNYVYGDFRRDNLTPVCSLGPLQEEPQRGYTYLYYSEKRFRVDVMSKVFEFEDEPHTLRYLSTLPARKHYELFEYSPTRDLSKFSNFLIDFVRGRLSETELRYKVLLEVAKNPWLILRYGLEGECKSLGVIVPEYGLDTAGFMYNLKTLDRLCPSLEEGIYEPRRQDEMSKDDQLKEILRYSEETGKSFLVCTRSLNGESTITDIYSGWYNHIKDEDFINNTELFNSVLHDEALRGKRVVYVARDSVNNIITLVRNALSQIVVKCPEDKVKRAGAFIRRDMFGFPRWNFYLELRSALNRAGYGGLELDMAFTTALKVFQDERNWSPIKVDVDVPNKEEIERVFSSVEKGTIPEGYSREMLQGIYKHLFDEPIDLKMTNIALSDKIRSYINRVVTAKQILEDWKRR